MTFRLEDESGPVRRLMQRYGDTPMALAGATLRARDLRRRATLVRRNVIPRYAGDVQRFLCNGTGQCTTSIEDGSRGALREQA